MRQDQDAGNLASEENIGCFWFVGSKAGIARFTWSRPDTVQSPVPRVSAVKTNTEFIAH